ncbi:MAG: MATE family efflux transporter [Bacteroidia bacterium]|nr:MATE family efflux transporter [Bacteroidia bacterium]
MKDFSSGNDLTIGREGKQIIHFAMPMLVGNIFQQLYNIINIIIVGKFLGSEAQAAVGSCFPIIFMFISFIIGIAMGASVVISQYFGAKDYDKIQKTVDTVNIFLFFSAIILSVSAILLSDRIFGLINMPEDIKPQAKIFFNIYIAGLIVFFGYNGVAAVLRGLGDSKNPLYFLIISTVLNIVLDLLFIVVFQFGIAGAAIATIISQGVAFGVAVYWLNKYHRLVHISFLRLTFDWDIFLKSLKIGLPAGLQHTFFSIGMIVLYRIVNDYGTIVIAAYSVAMGIDSFAVLPAMNFSIALSTFVGQNLGANKPERVKKGLISTLINTSLISGLVTILVFFFGKELMSMFSNDMGVIEAGYGYLRIVSTFYIIFSGMFIINGLLRGAGDTIVPMFISLISLWFIRLPLCYLFSLKLGVTGIWWGIPAGWGFGLICSYLYYLTGRWKSMVIIKYPIYE